MYKLSSPSPAIAENILKEVGFNSRLIGYRLKNRSGPSAVTLYSLVEAFGLLIESHPRIDFIELAEWIRTEYRDPELAARIGQISQKTISITEKNKQIGKIIFKRIVQCMEILNMPPDGIAEEGGSSV